MLEDRLSSLLLEWHEQQVQGRDVTAMELCRDCPELAEELSRRIAVLRQMNKLVASDPTAALPGNAHQVNLDFLAPAQAADELGRLGPYRVLKVLGKGGMGMVLLAEDPQLERRLALKIMLPHLAADPVQRQRFLREAKAAAAIEHEHIISILQVGEDRGIPFLAMPFLKGESLDARLKREGKLPASEVLRIGREMAEGLAAAHERGLIHRDIKPGNVWLEGSRERVKILDFGLARAAGDESHLTQSGAILGTPAYMAPEQARAEEIDHRADLFSFGCVLYVMATGAVPFKGKDTISTLRALDQHTPAPPYELNPAIPRGLSDLVLRLLAKEPKGRPASAAVVAAELAALAGAMASAPTLVEAPPGKASQEVQRPGRRRWLVAAGVIAALLLLVAGGGLALFLGLGERDPGQQPPNQGPGDGPLPAAFTNSLGMEFVLVPKGKSWLGGGNPGTKEVNIPYNFYLGKYEVTQEEWEKVTGTNPSQFKAVAGVSKEDQKQFPVEQVSWDDCQIFIKRVNDQVKEAGWVYRLPTEVEWEYACRGGPMKDKFESAFDFYLEKPTNTLLPDQANWEHGKGLKRTCKVGSYKPNRLGLYDMHGNVCEWCQDELKDDKGAPLRIDRGGGCSNIPGYWQAGYRHTRPPSTRESTLGLRLARVPVGGSTTKKDRLPLGPVLGPLDRLDPVTIPAAERFDWQPKGLVAVLGQHRQRHWGPAGWSISFSPDGKLLASAGDDKVRVWDTETMQERAVLEGGRSVAFSPVGKRLAAIHFPTGGTRLWDLTDGKAKGQAAFYAPDAADAPLSLAFAPNGKTLVMGHASGNLTLWDVQGQKPEQRAVLTGTKAGAGWVGFSPDGRLLAAIYADGGTTRLWGIDGAKWRERAVLPVKSSGVAFSPDSKLLAQVAPDTTLRLLDLATPEPKVKTVLKSDKVSVGYGGAPAFTPDGKTLACCSSPHNSGKQISMWDLSQPEPREVSVLEVATGVNPLAFSPDGRALAACGGNECGVRIWNVVGRQLKEKFMPGVKLTSTALSRNGRLLAVGCWDGTAHLWDLSGAAPREQASFRAGQRRVQWLHFTRGGKSLIAICTATNLRQWDIGGSEPGEVAAIPQGGPFAVSPDGNTLAFNNTSSSTLECWDLSGAAPRKQAELKDVGVVSCLAFAPDGKTLAGGWQKKLLLWQVTKDAIKPGPVLETACAVISRVAFAPDGETLACAGDGGVVQLWNLSEAQPRAWGLLGQRGYRVRDVDFAPDGKTLAACSEEGWSVWDVAKGKKVREWRQAGGCSDIQYAPDGRHVIVTNANGTVYIVRLASAPAAKK
jgi:WD40 repeat protein/formylglycine-generating enzyme required for sulfatase activity